MPDEGQKLGDLLDRFSSFHHMSPDELAAFVGVKADRLGTLRTYTVPEERAPEFAVAVAGAAAATGATEARLMQVARVAKLLR